MGLFKAGGPDPCKIGFGARFIAAVSAGAIINPVNSSIMTIALVPIAAHFHAPADKAIWLVSIVYLVTSVSQPVMGRLADRFGAFRIYVCSLAPVAVGGVLGSQATSLLGLILARALLGLGSAAAYPAALAMVRAQERRLGGSTPAPVLAALAMAGQVTMAIGPTLGGLLLGRFGWQALFLINLPLAVICLTLALSWLPRDSGAANLSSTSFWTVLDPAGVALFSAMMVAFLFFIMNLLHPIWWLLAVTVALGGLFTLWEMRAPNPFIDVRTFAQNAPLTATYVRGGLSMVVLFSFTLGWSLWLVGADGFTPAVAGVVLMPMFVIGAVASSLASRLGGISRLLGSGALCLIIGSGCLGLAHGGAPLALVVSVSVVLGLATGVVVVANQAAMYGQADPEQTGTAAGLLRTSMNIGTMLSSSLIALIYGRRPSDGTLHILAFVLAAISAGLLASVLADRSLRRPAVAMA